VTASPICLALDTQDPREAAQLVRTLKASIGMAKVGMELFYAAGNDGYRRIAAEGVPVFLDLKLHDIPNTVRQGLTSLLTLDPRPAIVNVHATGGSDMLRAAREAVTGDTRLIAVTLLTSLSPGDIAAVGFDAARDTAAHVVALAQLVRRSGLDGVVCSPLDLAGVRAACGRDFLTVVPGIRPAEAGVQDQKRIATPEAARAAGADWLVIGRPITAAADPVGAAKAILASLRVAA
jgi:orotidine-5'-phosphate decarboxylase